LAKLEPDENKKFEEVDGWHPSQVSQLIFLEGEEEKELKEIAEKLASESCTTSQKVQIVKKLAEQPRKARECKEKYKVCRSQKLWRQLLQDAGMEN